MYFSPFSDCTLFRRLYSSTRLYLITGARNSLQWPVFFAFSLMFLTWTPSTLNLNFTSLLSLFFFLCCAENHIWNCRFFKVLFLAPFFSSGFNLRRKVCSVLLLLLFYSFWKLVWKVTGERKKALNYRKNSGNKVAGGHNLCNALQQGTLKKEDKATTSEINLNWARERRLDGVLRAI